MWPIGVASLLLLLPPAATEGLDRGHCPQPAPPPDAVLVLPGAPITLPCLEGQPEHNLSISWKLEGRILDPGHEGQVLPDGRLLLSSVSAGDSGRYSCHSGRRLLHSVRLLVEEPPEVPDVTCYRRSYEKDVLCEWRPARRPSMRTRARLWVRKGLMGETPKEQPCRYFPKTQKFTCRLSVQPGNDETSLLVFLCVGNAAGSAASKSQLFKANHVLKPDAPVNVSVEAVERAPHKLQVTWRYPLSWVSQFYRLRFQLRYRAEVSHTHSEVSQLQETSYLILDAWRGQRHHIQVRGLEEFGYGSWSEWSKEATGIPWTDPSTPESETLSYTSQFATDDSFCEDNALFLTPVPPSGTEAPAAGDPAGVLRWTFCVAACTLAVGIALFTGIVIRYRRKWHPSSPREGKAAAALQYSLVPLAPASPTSAAPLLPCPASPCSTSSGPSPGSTASSPCHLANVDYFLMPR